MRVVVAYMCLFGIVLGWGLSQYAGQQPVKDRESGSGSGLRFVVLDRGKIIMGPSRVLYRDPD